MRSSLRKLAAAAASISIASAVATATAFAAPPTVPSQPSANFQDGDLFLIAFDTATQQSLALDLGLNFSQISVANMTPASGLTLDFGTTGGDSAVAGWNIFSGSAASGIQWMVVADQQGSNGTLTGAGLATTTQLATISGNIPNVQIGNADTNLLTFYTAATSFTGDTVLCTGNPCQTNSNANSSWAGTLGSHLSDTSATPNEGAPALSFANAAAVGNSMNFWLLSSSATKSVQSGNATLTQYADAGGVGKWLLDANGNLTYTIPAVSAVPLPAAVWLLLSGLTGLGVLGRRRANDAVAA